MEHPSQLGDRLKKPARHPRGQSAWKKLSWLLDFLSLLRAGVVLLRDLIAALDTRSYTPSLSPTPVLTFHVLRSSFCKKAPLPMLFPHILLPATYFTWNQRRDHLPRKITPGDRVLFPAKWSLRPACLQCHMTAALEIGEFVETAEDIPTALLTRRRHVLLMGLHGEIDSINRREIGNPGILECSQARARYG